MASTAHVAIHLVEVRNLPPSAGNVRCSISCAEGPLPEGELHALSTPTDAAGGAYSSTASTLASAEFDPAASSEAMLQVRISQDSEPATPTAKIVGTVSVSCLNILKASRNCDSWWRLDGLLDGEVRLRVSNAPRDPNEDAPDETENDPEAESLQWLEDRVCDIHDGLGFRISEDITRYSLPRRLCCLMQ